jgi:hypothetical protein
MLASFADHATVKDEGTDRHGRAAIRDWIEETTRKYSATADPKDVAGTTRQPAVKDRGGRQLSRKPDRADL